MLYQEGFADSLGLTQDKKVVVFGLNGENFRRDRRQRAERQKTDDEAFTIVKTNRHLDLYNHFTKYNPKEIFEVGYFEGGSSVFIDRLYEPNGLTCVDNRKTRIGPVDNYIERRGRQGSMHVLHNVDQADKETLQRLVDENHPNGLDMVFDDASHFYHQTKATLSVLLPKVRPGGFYVIEDYGWAHAAQFQSPEHPWAKFPGLGTLVFELMMVLASGSGILRDIYLDIDACVLQRGETEFKGPFEPLDYAVARGKTFPVL